MNTKFTKATDTQHQIKLESSLISAMWHSGAAMAGEKAPFEVLTAFVGNGADIKITGKSDKGKKLGKIKGEIKNNKYIGELEIPADTQLGDFVYFEVDLPQNGLNGQSNKIQVYPPIEITNMKWSAKEAREGDLLTLSADIKGVEEGTDLMVLIYEYDKDAIHDRIAQLPTTVKSKKMEISWEYQYIDRTGDIPTDGEMKKYNKNYAHPEYFFTIKINDKEFGKKQESGLLRFKDWIEVKLVNHTGKEKYTLYLPDGTNRQGNFNNDGILREDKIPPGKYHIEVKVQ